MELDFTIMAAMAFMGFIAAFIDSVVGGGGLISVPTLMWSGLPMLNVLGTNKFASTMGAFAGFLTYLRSGTIDKKIMRIMFPLSFIGSVIGVFVVREIPPDFLRPLVVVMLIVIAIYSVAKKNWGADKKSVRVSHKNYLLGLILIFVLGFYDGFFYAVSLSDNGLRLFGSRRQCQSREFCEQSCRCDYFQQLWTGEFILRRSNGLRHDFRRVLRRENGNFQGRDLRPTAFYHYDDDFNRQATA